MQDDNVVDRKLSPEEAEELMHRVMWRQARLSIAIAAVFIVILVLIPLLNLFAPDVAAMPIGGFPLSWLVLGVLFYPVTWVLSAIFVKTSDELEDKISKEHAK